MSKDGYLPDDVTESMLPGADEDHHTSCPQHEDAPEIYKECEGEGECKCQPPNEDCKPRDPDCICAEIFEQAEDDKAEARYERMREEAYCL